MSRQGTGIFRYILAFLLILTLIRLSPLILRMIQAMAIGVRGYWWAILPALAISGVLWKIIRRESVTKKAEDQFDDQNLRDVTDSSKVRQDQPQ